ncbi:putative membrane protein [Desulfosporosinus orientis DSM 765]|uniref:Putative membrane protein n=1 Tax=Desulfosporosinus orientis (strain ATCC 19365 / DSM 765 / NCIMB 8382 / VKM B-1628 / Singapore I) TaxID=768706 RepID=G7WAC5_DESOD|nr:aromatic acid exporter family protein [Desulfosporosinus orientis]AET66474.1 putative membrane protein [Desulfosporosinus orientis DSM 765]
MLIGARTLKTGLAVTATLFICKMFSIEPASFAAMSAVVNMQPSVSKSLNNAWQQIGVHLLAVVFSLMIGLLFGTNPLLIGITAILLILVCNWIGWSSGIVMGIVSIIFILDSPKDTFLTHALSRSLSIFVGLGIALVINRILAPPRYKSKFINSLTTLVLVTSNYFLESLHAFIHAGSLTYYQQKDSEKQKALLDEVNNLYEHAREELTPKDHPLFIERLLEICRGFIERGETINQMTEQRVTRRRESYSPTELQEITSEFKEILGVMAIGYDKLTELINSLTTGITEKQSMGSYEEDILYWEMFDQAINNWNSKVYGVFYLRALMEVSVVATELRWAGRRTKSLLNMLHQEYAKARHSH